VNKDCLSISFGFECRGFSGVRFMVLNAVIRREQDDGIGMTTCQVAPGQPHASRPLVFSGSIVFLIKLWRFQ
jgi:hypothetical protein